MWVVVHDPGRKALFEQVPAPSVSAVEALCVDPVQAVHPCRHLFEARLDEKVIVRAEEAPREAPPAEPLGDVRQKPEETLPVDVVAVDQHAPDTA